MKLSGKLLGNAFTLFIAVTTGGCDMTASPNSQSGGPAPSHVTIAESGATVNATLSIPRYKIYQHPDTPRKIWLGLGMESGYDTYYSADGGSTWTGVAVKGWEYHLSMAGNADGYVHFIDRGQPAASYHRMKGTSFQPEHRTDFADYGGQTTSGNINVNGREIVVFTRNQEDDTDPIHYHRSTDNGETWEGGIVPGTGNPSDLRHRIGSAVIDGEITLVYWKGGGAEDGDTVTLFRWNGSEFEKVDHTYVTAARSPWTREYALTQDESGVIHLVTWDRISGQRGVRHTTRTLGSDWSAPETVVTWDNDEIMPQLSAVGERVLLTYMYHPGSSEDAAAQAYYKTWAPDTGWSKAGKPVSGPDSEAVRYPIAPQRVPSTSPFAPVVWTEGESFLWWKKQTVRYRALRLD